MFDQMKMAKKMMAGMSPSEIKDLMKQAQESKNMFDKQIEEALDRKIKELGLISRDEVEQMINDRLN